jgi:3-keto-disaccharide hydrolase
MPLDPIFNGSDLTGWKVPNPNPFWKVVQGVLVGENDPAMTGSLLFTQALYQDFLLEAEVRWSGEIDSGIMLRKPELQLQLGVSRSLQRDMTCSFYTGSYPPSGQAQGVAALWREGDWNTIRLQALGNLFNVWLNGSLVTEYSSPNFAQPASIGLQIHADLPMKVEFRTIRGTTAPVTDADEDGLPDAWERARWATVRHAAAEDPDGDGLSNLVEYALGLDPNGASVTGLPTQGIQEIDGKTYPTFTVTRNPAATALVFRPEISTDLTNWRSGEPDVVIIEDTPARLQVRDAAPMNSVFRRFFRLVVATP